MLKEWELDLRTMMLLLLLTETTVRPSREETPPTEFWLRWSRKELVHLVEREALCTTTTLKTVSMEETVLLELRCQ